jgi:hypothetical protein
VCVAWREESLCYTPDFSLGCMLLVCVVSAIATPVVCLSYLRRQVVQAMACGLSKGWWTLWGG